MQHPVTDLLETINSEQLWNWVIGPRYYPLEYSVPLLRNKFIFCQAGWWHPDAPKCNMVLEYQESTMLIFNGNRKWDKHIFVCRNCKYQKWLLDNGAIPPPTSKNYIHALSHEEYYPDKIPVKPLLISGLLTMTGKLEPVWKMVTQTAGKQAFSTTEPLTGEALDEYYLRDLVDPKLLEDVK